MASNPEVSKLIAELSSILNENRQKRNVMDSMLAGLKQGREMAQSRDLKGSAGNSVTENEVARVRSPAESSYGNDKGASPFSYRNSPSPSAKALSPSTTREGRLGLASRYAETQGRERELLSKNPYTAREDELLGTNPYTSTFSNPTNDAVAEEAAKREMQRSGAGSPLGGAGREAPPGLDPAVVNAVSGSGGPIGQMGNPMVNTGGPQQPGPAANLPPAGWSDKDYALLQALSQRAPGG